MCAVRTKAKVNSYLLQIHSLHGHLQADKQ